MLPLLVSMEKYEHEKAVQIDCIIHSGGMEIHIYRNVYLLEEIIL